MAVPVLRMQVLINAGQANAATGTEGDKVRPVLCALEDVTMLAWVWTGAVCMLSDYGRVEGRLQASLPLAETGLSAPQNCRASADAVAAALGIPADQVLIESTGVIGRQLKMEALLEGVPQLAKTLEPNAEAAHHAAVAITTTDLVSKSAALEVGPLLLRLRFFCLFPEPRLTLFVWLRFGGFVVGELKHAAEDRTALQRGAGSVW